MAQISVPGQKRVTSNTCSACVAKPLSCRFGKYGGETGIRTLDTLRYTRFPSVRLQPLGHLSIRVASEDFITGGLGYGERGSQLDRALWALRQVAGCGFRGRGVKVDPDRVISRFQNICPTQQVLCGNRIESSY